MHALAPPSYPTPFAVILALLEDPAHPIDGNLVGLMSGLLLLAEEDLAFIPYHTARNPRPSPAFSVDPIPTGPAFRL